MASNFMPSNTDLTPTFNKESMIRMSLMTWNHVPLGDLLETIETEDYYFYLQDAVGNTLLQHMISIQEEEATVEIIIRAPHPSYLDILNDADMTALHKAVLHSDPELTRKLIIAGANTQLGKRDFTPLHLACANRDIACIKALTDPIVTEQELNLIANNYSIERFKPKLPPNFDLKNEDHATAFHIAVFKGHLEAVQHMVRLGANVETREGVAGMNALHLATASGHYDIVKFLVRVAGASLTAKTFDDQTAYDIAIMVGVPVIADEVCQFRQLIRQCDSKLRLQ